MARRRTEQEKRIEEQEERFLNKLKEKKVPLLILDERWHELFPERLKTPEIKQMEKQLKLFLKEQGKLTNYLKNMENTKKKLMERIIVNMNAAQVNEKEAKKQEKSQEFILEINKKIEKTEQELIEIPERMKDMNEQLLLESMRICYRRLKENQEDIERLEKWVEQAREELKERLLVKQDKEIQSASLYSYMHQMLGREVIEIFDQENRMAEGDKLEE